MRAAGNRWFQIVARGYDRSAMRDVLPAAGKVRKAARRYRSKGRLPRIAQRRVELDRLSTADFRVDGDADDSAGAPAPIDGICQKRNQAGCHRQSLALCRART